MHKNLKHDSTICPKRTLRTRPLHFRAQTGDYIIDSITWEASSDSGPARVKPIASGEAPQADDGGLSRFRSTGARSRSRPYLNADHKQAYFERPLLGRVDGFDQDEAESKGDERAVILRRLLASKCDTLEAFELADPFSMLVECFRKEGGHILVLDRYGIAGHIPRWRAASRFDLES